MFHSPTHSTMLHLHLPCFDMNVGCVRDEVFDGDESNTVSNGKNSHGTVGMKQKNNINIQPHISRGLVSYVVPQETVRHWTQARWAESWASTTTRLHKFMPTPANSRQGVDLSRRTWTAWLENNALHIGLVSDGTYKNKKHINSIGGRANQDNMVLLSVTADSGACRELCSDLLLRFRRFVPKGYVRTLRGAMHRDANTATV